MPLSEDDQRIFSEIERSFYESDPDFVRRLGKPKSTTHTTRNLRLAAVGFVVGLVVLVASFTVSVVLGFLGFSVMVLCGVVFVDNARRAGQARIQSLSDKVKETREATSGKSIRDRFKRGE